MIAPYRISYNGYNSHDFDVICQLAFDSDSGEVSSYLSRDAVASETYRGDINRVSSYKYTETLAPTITLIDKDFGDFSLERQRTIMKWLTSKNTPSFMSVYHDDSEVISYEILGAPTEISTYKLGNGRVVGFQFVFSSISPFAYSPLHTVTKTIVDAVDNIITINVDTDDSAPVYPRITIKQTGLVVAVPSALNTMSDMVYDTVYYDGENYYWRPTSEGYTFKQSTTNPNLSTTSVKLTNKHTDVLSQTTTLDSTIIKNNNSTETIVVDGANKVISSSSVNRIFGDDFVNWVWLPLYDGKNEIAVEGNCEIEMSYREIRKVGEY